MGGGGVMGSPLHESRSSIRLLPPPKDFLPFLLRRRRRRRRHQRRSPLS